MKVLQTKRNAFICCIYYVDFNFVNVMSICIKNSEMKCYKQTRLVVQTSTFFMANCRQISYKQ